ncbi:transposase [Desulfosporosinus shakirovi]|uniref:transposase n=1 Tax=Desulfosporosinus shakirovi TaxID=2885154 RepID=UPI001E63AE17|nr:transposase [Desulfosporosinus sp. SRJS8]MCB8815320.1 transposase [Desulfosporosinus sp. SRJS8]
MSKKRKTYSPAEKAKIVLEVLREESSLNEIATTMESVHSSLAEGKLSLLYSLYVLY